MTQQTPPFCIALPGSPLALVCAFALGRARQEKRERESATVEREGRSKSWGHVKVLLFQIETK